MDLGHDSTDCVIMDEEYQGNVEATGEYYSVEPVCSIECITSNDMLCNPTKNLNVHLLLLQSSIVGFFAMMFGVKRNERLLPIGTPLTVVGEAIKDGIGTVRIQRPLKGPFYVSYKTIDQLITNHRE